jgi:translation elongation factor EF-G
MTQGRAFFKRHFKGYEEAPHEVAQKVIEDHAKEKEEELAAAH